MTSTEQAAMLAELRTTVSRFRAEAAQIKERAEATRDGLRQQQSEIARMKADAEREAAGDARDGALGRARKELQERLDRHATTWRDVMTGADTHWTAVRVREEFASELVAKVRELADNDPEFRAEYGAVVDRSREANQP